MIFTLILIIFRLYRIHKTVAGKQIHKKFELLRDNYTIIFYYVQLNASYKTNSIIYPKVVFILLLF